jgi:LacI family transcriptional regulator
VGGTHPPSLYEFLDTKAIPFVTTWTLDRSGRRPCVGFDNREIGRTLANYLLDLGHREFGVIAQLTRSSDRAAGRVMGIRDALGARGLELQQQHLIERPHMIIEGQLALRTLMLSPEPPTAVICGTDVLAFGALVECQRLGIAVPAELSIAGINDVEFAAHLNPALTTMRIPALDIGSRAADYLLGRLHARPVVPVTEVQVNLIVRGSTGPAPGLVRRRPESTS